ncbi:MAG: hypothetical protein IJ731_06680 [Eubacterium sp.]|nr:hypothetical protein [Eubacterium sp.]
MLDFDVTNLETGMTDSELVSLESMANECLSEGNYEEHENMFADILAEYGIEGYGDNPMEGPSEEEFENFDSIEGDDIYNSGEAMEHWEYQGDTNRCAQFSQLFVIEEFTGLELDPDSFCEFSEMNGWFDENGGTTLEDMNKMLDYFGIQNEMSQGNSFENLMECLENDGRAIVALDSGEYWNGESAWEDLIDPNGVDHAVEVIGYNAETESVILNDSGTLDGCGEEIPLDTFLDAWEDSGNMMIECYK